ncbi:hypothetical protein F383_34783 [Gossypium arboreum]|uniref:Uncharacterized protein n=1 Tax=Gossypium arboreum TaxID=29729 RepID=A0A0B0N578_GOSAR|nr:hypothetical protein F383_34783 [Gossypium arboreum]
MAIHARMPGRVLGRVKPVGYTDFTTRPSPTPVCDAV